MKSEKIIAIALGTLLPVTLLSSCRTTTDPKKDFSTYKTLSDVRADSYFGTTSEIHIYYDAKNSENKTKAEGVIERIGKELTTIHQKLSVEVPSSDISRYNAAGAGEKIEISSFTYDILEKSKELYRQTQGAYNPSVSLLVDLWGFSPRFFKNEMTHHEKYDRESCAEELPDEKYIEAFQQLTDYESVQLIKEDDTYYVVKSDTSVTVDGVAYTMQIDLGGYGKGYAADRSAQMITEAGFEYGYVSFGGSSLYLLNAPQESKDYPISLTYPTKYGSFVGETFGSYNAHGAGISTSGSYVRSYEVDGVEYCHIIDGKTGYPIQTRICSVNIVGGSAAENDAYTTALSVMGLEHSIEFVNRYLTDRKVTITYQNDEEERFEVYTNFSKDELTLKYKDLFYLFGVGDGSGKIIVR